MQQPDLGPISLQRVNRKGNKVRAAYESNWKPFGPCTTNTISSSSRNLEHEKSEEVKPYEKPWGFKAVGGCWSILLTCVDKSPGSFEWAFRNCKGSNCSLDIVAGRWIMPITQKLVESGKIWTGMSVCGSQKEPPLLCKQVWIFRGYKTFLFASPGGSHAVDNVNSFEI